MKHKIFLLLLSFVTSLCASAQLISYEELQKQVAELNAQMPMSMGPTMQMTSVTLTKNAVVYRAEVNTLPSQTQSSQSVKLDEQTVRENMKNMLAGNEWVKPFFQSLIALNMEAKYIITYNGGKDELSVVFTPQDLSEMMERKVSDEDKTDLILNESKKTLPLSIMNGMSLVNVQKNGTWIEFIAEVDETLYDIDQFERNRASMRESMVTMLKGDVSTMQQCTVFVAAGYGIRYIFRGSVTHKEVVIALSLQELSALVIANQSAE